MSRSRTLGISSYCAPCTAWQVIIIHDEQNTVWWHHKHRYIIIDIIDVSNNPIERLHSTIDMVHMFDINNNNNNNKCKRMKEKYSDIYI